ncbi:RNA 2',3'-cyclic phosphodiesterase [Alkalibacillus almallahensis]|uniref:RNA 2',3'-cyclic phosphodiesterase n=1 Tax=Alkalibacillus almallahensis TaxID=1379154 RepID=UPI00141E35D0|nr:RNA 2',3'-cyclic phosphodiesterase [Alkalibacillus almallahensis]NIK13457.1 2'-5' RNA ligase [Alkalibacillus almallahensis]
MSHYFIGIKVPHEIGQKLVQTQQELQPHVSYKNWVHQDDFHVTLKFLGHVDETLIPTLKEDLRQIELSNPIDLDINKTSYFGKPTQPRVLFAEVVFNKALESLKNEVEYVMMQYGFPKENRPFKPHITLAKKWRDHTVECDSNLLEHTFNSSLSFQANAFQLFQIHPSDEPKYQVIDQF